MVDGVSKGQDKHRSSRVCVCVCVIFNIYSRDYEQCHGKFWSDAWKTNSLGHEYKKARGRAHNLYTLTYIFCQEYIRKKAKAIAL